MRFQSSQLGALVKKLAVCSVIAAALFAAPAFAVDMAVKAPPRAPTPVYSWTGFYVGLHAGYGWVNSTDTVTDVTGNPFVAQGEIPGTLGLNPSGFVGGGQIGYNLQSANIVYGLEADIAYTDFRKSATQLSPDGNTRTLTARETLDPVGTVRARLGVTPAERSLAYITGGFAYGHAELSTAIGNLNGCVGTNCQAGSTSVTKGGWTVGGGWEYALNNNWTTRVEYLHFDLGSVSHPMTDPPFPATFSATAQVKGNIVRAGLNYRFQ